MTASAPPSLPDARPSFELVPAYTATTGWELRALLGLVGMSLLPWQWRFLDQLLGEDASGNWSAPEAGLIVPRQNGKSYVMAARILAGLFLTNESMIIYTAHRLDTALEIYNLVDSLIRSNPQTESMIMSTTHAAGKETITMVDGRRFKIMARSKSTGRGITGDCLIFDEALELRDHQAMNSFLPTLITKPNAQLIYASSAGDSGSVILAGVRDRAHGGLGDHLLFTEYAADPHADLDDESVWAQTNPALGTLISLESVRRERERMSADGFRTERLGIWRYETNQAVIPVGAWRRSMIKSASEPEPGRFGLSFDVATDRSWATVTAAWFAERGVHVRTSRHDQGDHWVIEEVRALAERYGVRVTYDNAGPASDVAEALKLAGVEVEGLTVRDYASACQRFLSGLVAETITHEPVLALDQAAAVATSRAIGDGWAFSRRRASLIPISPVTSAVLAVWGLDHLPCVQPVARPMIYV